MVPMNDVMMAVRRWSEVYGTGADFNAFVGITKWHYDGTTNCYELDEGQTRAIKTLCGPYWQALLKAYQIRNKGHQDVIS